MADKERTVVLQAPGPVSGPGATTVAALVHLHPSGVNLGRRYPLEKREILVGREGEVETLYVLDEAKKPVPASQVSGTVTVLADGKMHKVELSPAEGNSLQGELPVAPSGRVVATASLKISGKAVSARFTPSA